MGVQPEAPTESSQGAQSPRAKGATSEVPPGQKAKGGKKNHDHLLGSTPQKGHGHSRLSYQPNLCKVGGEEERLHSYRACDKKSLIVPQLFERLHFPTQRHCEIGSSVQTGSSMFPLEVLLSCEDFCTGFCCWGKHPQLFSKEKLHPTSLEKEVTKKSPEELEHKIVALENRVKRLKIRTQRCLQQSRCDQRSANSSESLQIFSL